MSEVRTHKDLDVWQESIQLVSDLYQIVSKFPADERYGLTSQIKRAVVSVPTNISEGAARGGIKEYIHFCYVALGSLSELETLLIVSKNLKLINESQFETISNTLTSIIKKLLNFIKYLKTKLQ